MKIGVNSRIFQNSESGIPYFIKHLYSNLIEIDKRNKYMFFQTKGKKLLGNTKIIDLPQSRFSNILFDGILIDRLVKQENINIFHGPSHILPIIRRKNTKYIVTIHDLSFMIFPEHNSKLFNAYLKIAVGRSLNNADAIVADSNSTKEDINKFYNIDKSRIRVIHLGISQHFLESDKNPTQAIIKEKYFFSLTTHPKRKNIYSVLQAFSKSEKLQNHKYVIAGLMSDAYLKDLLDEINKLKLNDKVIIFGYSTEAELKNLYRNAIFFVYPSFYEGFGFPILESMACGTPVIASNTSSMTEIMPSEEWLINPNHVDDLRYKMEQMIEISSGKREAIIKENLNFSSKFTWEKTATKYLKLFNELSND